MLIVLVAAVVMTAMTGVGAQGDWYVNCTSESDTNTIPALSNTTYYFIDCSKAVIIQFSNITNSSLPVVGPPTVVEHVMFVLEGPQDVLPRIYIAADVLRNISVVYHDAIIANVQYNQPDLLCVYLLGEQLLEDIRVQFINLAIQRMKARALFIVENHRIGRNIQIDLQDCTFSSVTISSALLSTLGGRVGSLDSLSVRISNCTMGITFIVPTYVVYTSYAISVWRTEGYDTLSRVSFHCNTLVLNETMQGYQRGAVLLRIFKAIDVRDVSIVVQRLQAAMGVASAFKDIGTMNEVISVTYGVVLRNVTITLLDSTITVVSGRTVGVTLRNFNETHGVSILLKETKWNISALLPTMVLVYGGSSSYSFAEPHGASIVEISFVNATRHTTVHVSDSDAVVVARNASTAVDALQNYSAAYARFVYLQDVGAQDTVVTLTHLSLIGNVSEATRSANMQFGFMVIAVGAFQVENAAFTALMLSLETVRVDADVKVATPLINPMLFALSRRAVLAGIAFVQLTSNCTRCNISIVHSQLFVHRLQVQNSPSGLPYAAGFVDAPSCTPVTVINMTAFVDCSGVRAYVQQCGGFLTDLFEQFARVYTSDRVAISITHSMVDASSAYVALDSMRTPMTAALYAMPFSVIAPTITLNEVQFVTSETGAAPIGGLIVLSATTLVGLMATLVDVSGFPSIVSSQLASGTVQRSQIVAHRVLLPSGYAPRASVAGGEVASAAFIEGSVAATAFMVSLDSSTIHVRPGEPTRLLVSQTSSWDGVSQLSLMGCSRWGLQRLTQRLSTKLLVASKVLALAIVDNDDRQACEGTDTIEVVPVLKVTTPRAAMAATLAAMIGSAVMGGAASGSAMRVETSMAIMRATRLCEQGEDTDEEELPGSAFVDNPLQLSIGSSWAGGAVVGNTIIVVAWFTVLEFVVPCIKRVRSLDSLRVAFADFLAVLPGDGAAAVLLLLQPTVAASVALLSGPPQAAMILGVLGVMLYVLAIGLVVMWLLRDFPLVGVAIPSPRRGTILSRWRAHVTALRPSPLVDALEKFYLNVFWRRCRWVLRKRKEGAGDSDVHDRDVLRRLNPTMAGYRVGCHWFSSFDVALPVSMGVLVGAAAGISTPGSCEWIAWTAAIPVGIAALLSVWYRPYATLWMNFNQGIGNLFTAFVLLVSCVSPSNPPLLDTMVTVQSFIALAAVALDLITALVSVISSDVTSSGGGSTVSTVATDDACSPHLNIRSLSSQRRATNKGKRQDAFLTTKSTRGSPESVIDFTLSRLLKGNRVPSPEAALETLIRAACSCHAPSQVEV